MPKYRIEYKKTGYAKFLSHLELLRTLNRALRRARFPLAYTCGFKPHPRVSFGPSLGVGVEGLHEYMDVELEREESVDDCLHELARQLPAGLKAEKMKLLGPHAEGLGRFVNAAWYRFYFPDRQVSEDGVRWLLEGLSGGDEQWLYRREKDGKIIDVRPGIKRGRFLVENGPVLDLLVKAGEGEVPLRGILNVLVEKNAVLVDPRLIRVARAGLYRQRGEMLETPLGELKNLWED